MREGEAVRGRGGGETRLCIVLDCSSNTQPVRHACKVGGIVGGTKRRKGPRVSGQEVERYIGKPGPSAQLQ